MADEYAVKITVRNGLILRQMKRLGVKSQTELAKLAGIPLQTLNSLITLRKAPRNTYTGEWVDAAFALSSALQVEPEELWTSAQQGMALERNNHEINMSEEQVKQLASGESTDKPALGGEQSRILRGALSLLTPREEQVVRRRYFDEGLLEEIASDWGVSKTRIRQIECKALRKLKHPSRGLKKYFDEEVRAHSPYKTLTWKEQTDEN
jgi:DNA-directed RNA polymerase specialized sigma24 family protein